MLRSTVFMAALGEEFTIAALPEATKPVWAAAAAAALARGETKPARVLAMPPPRIVENKRAYFLDPRKPQVWL